MKEKIYETMENVIGWRLYDLEDYKNTTEYDLNNLEKWWAKLDYIVDKQETTVFDLRELEDLRDSIGFIMDFVRAVAIIDNSEELENKSKSQKQRDILEKHFNVVETDDELELEQWTNGGVDMILYFDKEQDIIEELEKYIDDFDIDEEIDLYRQGEDYKQHFTIRESLEDFENWLEFIQNVVNELKEV